MHELKVGQIVKNLIPAEPVVIEKVVPLAGKVAIYYTGVNTNIRNNTIVEQTQVSTLEIVAEEGSFNFSGDPNRFKLYAEAERINSAYQFDPLFAVNCSVVDPLPHQVEAVYRYLLPLPQIRFLLADDTGAGKTIMTGLLLKELMMRGFVERALIITPGGLTRQWQEDELGLKFNMRFKLANRAAFNSDPNIFSSSNLIVTSIDFIRNEDVLNVLKDTRWDIVVVDEAHKLSVYEYGSRKYVSKRYEAVESLKHLADHLLLLTATPHRGRRDTFRNLLQLLDEDIFASDTMVTERVQEVRKSGTNKFFIRRLKEQMKDWDGNPLFKDRVTRTVKYQLTKEEKQLYNKVTDYLTRKKEEARQQSNVHVSLALMVMQRRLVSSIYAIMRTLKNRYDALVGVLEAIRLNPSLWKQRHQIEDFDVENLDDFEELEDDEREKLEGILTDPRKFKLFTTAQNLNDLKEEAEQVKQLYELAEQLYLQNQEEQKYKQLQELLRNEGVFDRDEKLVIFTEHKDTLDYLEDRLRNRGGFTVATIHGGKSVDERRKAQALFAKEAQILIATDAAGEGINLQFCRFLINWDIPWNPNRLEQRMGRIHRYGQKHEVLVFNMVAANTREGKVLDKLLQKLDEIRSQIGDDRVYDVISDIFEGINMDQIMDSVLNGKRTAYDDKIDKPGPELIREFQEKIREQREALGYSDIDYSDAKKLRDNSREKRLQPIYIKLFFEKAFQELDGQNTELRESVFRIDVLPPRVSEVLKEDYNISADLRDIYFCFDKAIFLDLQSSADFGRLHYINPGNPVFDSVVKVVRHNFKEDMLKGAVLVSPDDKEDYFAYFVRSQVADNRKNKGHENIADERLSIVMHKGGEFRRTSPAKFIDLYPPNEFAKKPYPPAPVGTGQVVEWSYDAITAGQYQEAESRIQQDIKNRKAYLEEAFNNVIMDLTMEVNDLQGKLMLGKSGVEDKLKGLQGKILTLQEKRADRLKKLEGMMQLSAKLPEVLGCAYVLPLTELEYKNHYGMSRDDEVEAIAMQVAWGYEEDHGWNPKDVSRDNEGYDILSTNPDGIRRYIEVKGRSADGDIMVSENEFNRLSQLENDAWLYIVTHCKAEPRLYRIQNPGKTLRFEVRPKGVQYFLAQKEWKANIVNS